MKKRLPVPVGLVVLVVAFALLTMPGSALAASAQPVSPSTLAYPAAFAPTPDGSSILFAERFTGQIRWLDPATGTSTPFFTVPNTFAGPSKGLLGLALHRSYPSNGRVWAFVTRTVSGTVKNQLLRINADGSGFAVLRSFP